MAKIVWPYLAQNDLRCIYDNTSWGSKIHASRYNNKLISGAGQFESHPESGQIVPETNNQKIQELVKGNCPPVSPCWGHALTSVIASSFDVSIDGTTGVVSAVVSCILTVGKAATLTETGR